MSLGNKMFVGVLWSALETLLSKSIQFIIGIILARILTPQEYGTLGVLMVFVLISTIFIESGFTKALIHKKDRTNVDISTVFVFNITISILFYALLYVTSPFIEKFYNIESLSLLLRVLSTSLIFNALFSVPITLLTIKLDFKTLTKINFSTSLLAGIIAVLLALNGYGIWALIVQTISKSVLTAILVHFLVSWKPSFIFSIKSFKLLFSYGFNLLISSILNRIVNDASSLFIAKYLSTPDLGFYTRGTQFSNFVSSSVSTVLDRVLLPGLVEVQDDLKLLVRHTKQILTMTSIVVVPIFFALFVLAKPIILILLTEKWIMAVPIMQIFCLARLITIFSGVSINLLYVIGKPNLVLKQHYVKIAVRLILLFISFKYGIIYIAIGELISTLIHFFINTYYPGKIMEYGAFKQIKDLSPTIVIGAIMATCIHLITMLFSSNLLKITFGSIAGILIYYLLIYFFQRNFLEILIHRIKNIKK